MCSCVFTVFNILVHVGVVLTYPILISIGTLLSVPGNAGGLFCDFVNCVYYYYYFIIIITCCCCY